METESNLIKFQESIYQIVRTKTSKWWSQINKIGIEFEMVNDWSTIFKNHITEICDDMIRDVTVKHEELTKEIDVLAENHQLLCRELQITPTDTLQDLNLYKKREILKNEIQQYEQLKEEKKNNIILLNKKHLELCHILGLQAKFLPLHPLPPSEIILEFKYYLEELELERFIRDENFLTFQDKIMKLTNKFNYKPASDYERWIMSNNVNFLVSDIDMEQIHSLYKKLKMQYHNSKESIGDQNRDLCYLQQDSFNSALQC